MNKLFSILVVLAFLLGCGSSKPDPRDHPDFVDTTDPTDLRMPGGAKSEGGEKKTSDKP